MRKPLFFLSLLLVCYTITPGKIFAQIHGKKKPHIIRPHIVGPHIVNFTQLADYRKAHPVNIRKHSIEQGEDKDGNFKFKPGPINGQAYNFKVKLPKENYRSNSPAPTIVFNGTQSIGEVIPPDINGAAGEVYVMETTNQQFDIYNKNGTINSTLDIGTFFSATPGASYFDPHVRYDAAHQRYIIVSDGTLSNGDGGIFLGISQTSDPTGNWYVYSVDDGVNSKSTLLDYPLIGFNKKWIVVTGNIFADDETTFTGVEGFIFNRDSLYYGAEGTVTTFNTDANSFSICPSETNDTTVATEYLVMDYTGDSASNGYVRTFTITGNANSPVFAPGFFIGVNQPWSENFTGAPQLGTGNTIDEDDARISNAVYINGSLWFAHTVKVPFNAPTNDAVDWWQINPATPGVEQFGRIADPNGVIYYYYPSISVNNAGNVLVGYSTSSPSIYASSEYSYRLSSDPLNTLESGYIFKNGLASYYQTFNSGRNRWGDFSGTCVDPVDNSFWTLQEFAALPANSWGTVIANLGGIPCAGKPTAGTAIPSSTVVCPGESATLTLNGNTTGVIGITVLWQQSPNGVTGWANAAGSDSITTQYLTPALTARAYFRCVVSCTGSGMSDTTAVIEVNINGIYSSANDTICSTGVHKIAAQGGGEINWYLNNSTSGVLATGDTLTADITGDTTFYVTSGSFNYYTVGPANANIGSGSYYVYFTRGLVFTALSNFTLDTVYIYPGSSGNLQVNLINALTGIVIDSVIVAIPNSAVGNETPIPLNMNIAGGAVYNITANNSTLSSMYRSSSGAVYPYTVPGVVSITDNVLDAAGYYYFFYDWRLHTGCVSARTPVNVDIAPIAITAKASAVSTCSGSPVTLTATGANTYSWQPGSLSGSSLSVSPLTGTTYTVTGTASNGCNGSASVAVNVTSTVAPAVAISTPGSAICTGTSVVFTATPTNGGASPSYQWKVNGNNAGTNSNTFTSGTLSNGDQVTCVLTSGLSCASPTTVTSNAITMTVNPLLTPSVNITTPNTTICAATSVTFTATPTNGGTTPAYQWKNNGTSISGATASTYSSSTLANNDVITVELTSDAECTSTTTATSNSLTMTVNPLLTPLVNITTPNTTICAGTIVTFTATPTNGGTTPAYQWKNNGASISGATASTYTSSALANNDVITDELTSDAECTTTTTATSNSITMTVNPLLTPSVNITTPNTTICAGTSVTFTATPTNGGTTPAYQWQNNGASITGATASTYSSSTLANNDVITVDLTSDAECTTTTMATSNSLTMTVNPLLTPSVNITTPNTTICAGTSVTFTATPTNGGTTPAYQWQNNGASITGATASTYSSSTLANNDVITVDLTSDAECTTTTMATSNSLTMTVNPLLTPSVNITTPNTTICAGTSVTFTATPTNGGTTPAYQWKNNGASITGATTSTYTSSELANNDVIIVELTSNAECTTTTTATSNSLTMTVNALVMPSVNITTPNTTICAATSVTFTATPTNGGATPAYQWKNNGASISGATTSTYTSSELANNDEITVEVTSDAECTTTTMATSNSLTMTVNPLLTPSVNITTPNTTICAGTIVTFTATPTNGGTTPAYQWKNNGASISGETASTYTSSALTNNDMITAELTSDAECTTTTNTATSNSLTMTVNALVTPSVSITTPNTTICEGTSVTFTATLTNGGTTPLYQWQNKGESITGATASTYSASSLENNDVITVVLTSDLQCVSPATVTSNPITMTVNPFVVPSVVISTVDTNICSGTNAIFTSTTLNEGNEPAFQWQINGVNISGATSSGYTSPALSDGDVISLEMSSNAACASPLNASSNSITIKVSKSLTPGITVSTPSTTVCSGTGVAFNAIVVNGGSSPVYQWEMNGSVTGTNNSTFIADSVVNRDIISCLLTTSLACATKATDTSNNISMTVTPTPGRSMASANSPLCENNSLQLTTPNVADAGFSWAGPDTFISIEQNPVINNVSVIDSGTYSVEVISNGCTSKPGTVSVVVNSNPAVPVITSAGSVLSSSSVTGNQWYLNHTAINGAIEQTYTATQSGWYLVMVTNAQDCSSSSDSIDFVSTSVSQVSIDGNIKIVPNPFSTQFNIIISNDIVSLGAWKINITDELGRNVYENKDVQYNNLVDLQNEASAVYFVNILTENEIRSFKIIKQE